MKPFVSTSENPHIKEEEDMWARIVSTGNGYAGIILIWDQKLCAYAHEVGLEFMAGNIGVQRVNFYAGRLKARAEKVFELISNSGEEFEVEKDFKSLISELGNYRNSISDFGRLRTIPERIHGLSHSLCDELYSRVVK